LKHVEARNKLIVKEKFCASNWLITEINKLLDPFIHAVFEKNASELKIETISLQTGLPRQ